MLMFLLLLLLTWSLCHCRCCCCPVVVDCRLSHLLVDVVLGIIMFFINITMTSIISSPLNISFSWSSWSSLLAAAAAVVVVIGCCVPLYCCLLLVAAVLVCLLLLLYFFAVSHPITALVLFYKLI